MKNCWKLHPEYHNYLINFCLWWCLRVCFYMTLLPLPIGPNKRHFTWEKSCYSVIWTIQKCSFCPSRTSSLKVCCSDFLCSILPLVKGQFWKHHPVSHSFRFLSLSPITLQEYPSRPRSLYPPNIGVLWGVRNGPSSHFTLSFFLLRESDVSFPTKSPK